MEYILWSFLNSSLLFLLYNTDAFVEYASLLRLKKIFNIDKYEEHRKSFPANTYWEYVLYNRSNFVTKLISCPICVSIWANFACFSVYRDPEGLVLNIWFTLFLYFGLCVMFRKAYDE